MSADPKAVDVIGVLRDLARLARDSGGDEGPDGNGPAYNLWQDAIKAHDAVAELIASDKAHDIAKGMHRSARNKPWEGKVSETSAALTAAWNRRAAALARCGGAS